MTRDVLLLVVVVILTYFILRYLGMF